MKDIFQFKQFEIDQRGSIMKINTDGVLLAVKANIKDCRRILDIGTGTGVIALILAQRFSESFIEAIEIDKESFHCAKLNFEKSPWASRLLAHHLGIENYESPLKFDLIVSNPPFFLDSLPNVQERKTLSRHGSIFFYELLFKKCNCLLTEGGAFQVIWPIEVRDKVLHLSLAENLYLNDEIYISSFPESRPFRVISSFKRKKTDLKNSEHFYIYKEKGVYSESYLQLLRPFFIKY